MNGVEMTSCMSYLRLSVLYFACFWSIIHVSGTLYRRSLVGYPNALCNDGTPGTYYHSGPRPGLENATNYILYLQGGGYCHTVPMCTARCTLNPSICSERTDLTKGNRGILSDNPVLNPYFHDWYKVELHYCTSDLHVGSRPASNETGGYHFRGLDVVMAMVDDLVDQRGMDKAENIILSGTSAGGAATAFLCNYLQEYMGPSVKIHCIVDAAVFYPNIPPYTEDCETFDDTIEAGSELWGAEMIEDFDLFGWWEDIEQPLLIGIPLWDTYGIGVPYCGSVDPEDLITWAEGMYPMMHQAAEDHPEMGFYIPGCLDHGMLNNEDRFIAELRTGEDELTYSDVAGSWYLGDGQHHQVWDDCDLEEPPSSCNPTCVGPIVDHADNNWLYT